MQGSKAFAYRKSHVFLDVVPRLYGVPLSLKALCNLDVRVCAAARHFMPRTIRSPLNFWLPTHRVGLCYSRSVGCRI